MPGIEYEQITTSYEFEDRAQYFMEAVEKLAKRYTASHIEVTNSTFERMEELQRRIAELQKSGKDNDLLKSLTKMEYNFQVESANKNRVVVMFYARTSRTITPFGQKVDDLAKTFRGVKSKDESEVYDFGDDDSEESPRFVASFVYDFKNDIKDTNAKHRA